MGLQPRPVPRPLDQGGKKPPHAVRAYSHDLVAFTRWFEQTMGEDFDPKAVDPRDIQDYKDHLIAKGLKPATINHRLIALKGFFRWAKRENLVTDNPFEVLEQVLVKEQKDTAHQVRGWPEWVAFTRCKSASIPARDDIIPSMTKELEEDIIRVRPDVIWTENSVSYCNAPRPEKSLAPGVSDL